VLDPKIIRKHILKMAYDGQSVHVGCAFSIVEIICALMSEIKFDPKSPDRDYLVLSKGHGAMALYAAMRELGFLDQADLDNYFKDGSRLHGLAEAHIPGIDATTGSLGHGLPIAVGMALGLKRMGKPQRVFCVAGDGEMNEGSMWEALLFAAHHKLDNLTLIIDFNGLQAMGRTGEVLNLEHFRDKLTAFNWDAISVNGHHLSSLAINIRGEHWDNQGKPRAIIARTIKGRGCYFMEDNNSWHYKRLNEDTYKKALEAIA
jgi:transketolase